MGILREMNVKWILTTIQQQDSGQGPGSNEVMPKYSLYIQANIYIYMYTQKCHMNIYLDMEGGN